MGGLAETVEATLADLRALETGSRFGGIRTNILDLVVICDDEEGAEEVAEIIATLPFSRPSRAIVALAHAEAAPVTYDARVFCIDHDGREESVQVCSELVRLSAGEGGAALPSLIASLLLPDLPVFLLWRAEPVFSGLMIDRLWPLVSRVVVDSTSEPGTLEALPELVRKQPSRDVTDLSWTKITGWRDAVARAFDTPDNVGCLNQLTRLEIHHAGASHDQARLLAGWVMSRIDRRLEVAIECDDRPDMRSGSLTSVCLRCPTEDFLVERLDEGVGRVIAPRIALQTVPLRVPKLRELVALELEIFDRDATFEDALAWAADVPA